MKVEILGHEIEYDSKNVKIYDSYKVTGIVEMAIILEKFKERTNYKSTRSINSWLREWRTHNKLYRWGLFRSHTKDVDLNEDEKWYRRIVYFILGRF